jgi:ketosteroid isomerase-like protein
MLQRFARAAFQAWNRGDFRESVPNIDDPGVETHVPQGARALIGLDAIYYGPEGHCRAMEDWNDAWQAWDADIQDVIDEAPNRVVIVARVHGVGAASGIDVNEWMAVRYTFREGRILRVDGAFDSTRERLFEALDASA